MNCFNHEKAVAVGQCDECKKGLCKECFSKYEGFCKDCYTRLKSQLIEETNDNIKKVLKLYRSDIVTSIISGVLGAVFIGAILIWMGMPIFESGTEFLEFVFAIFMPTGFMAITKIIGKDPDKEIKDEWASAGIYSANDYIRMRSELRLFGNLLSFIVRIIVGIIIGIPSAIYLIVKLVIINKKLSNLKAYYKEAIEDFEEEIKE